MVVDQSFDVKVSWVVISLMATYVSDTVVDKCLLCAVVEGGRSWVDVTVAVSIAVLHLVLNLESSSVNR